MSICSSMRSYRPLFCNLQDLVHRVTPLIGRLRQHNLHSSYSKVLSYRKNVSKLDIVGCSKIPIFTSKSLSSTTGNSGTKCWNCDSDVKSLAFCDECHKLQPLDQRLNYYEVLGITELSFSVDTKTLTKTFRKLQGQFHPDKFSQKHEKEQQYALERSSEINKAYKCLLLPVERALYLLELAGKPLHEGQIDLNPEFLMEIMEVNEELEEATDQEDVADIGRKNQKILDDLLQEADAAFMTNDIDLAREIVAKIKYYNNIYWKIKDYERQHGIVD